MLSGESFAICFASTSSGELSYLVHAMHTFHFPSPVHPSNRIFGRILPSLQDCISQSACVWCIVQKNSMQSNKSQTTPAGITLNSWWRIKDAIRAQSHTRFFFMTHMDAGENNTSRAMVRAVNHACVCALEPRATATTRARGAVAKGVCSKVTEWHISQTVRDYSAVTGKELFLLLSFYPCLKARENATPSGWWNEDKAINTMFMRTANWRRGAVGMGRQEAFAHAHALLPLRGQANGARDGM